MKRPEPIELENNLGPDAVTGEINRVPWMAYDVDEMDLYIAELEQKLAEKDKEIESLKASHYADSVDAGMRERRLKRALWLARALALSRFDVDEYLRKYTHCNSRFWNDGFNTFNEACEEMQKAINIAEAKCRAKAEEYK